jgi:beta-alanine--pyruvate transaminase
MGAVVARDHVHDALMQGPAESIELAHGYTYSGHPLSCAAGLATLDVYRDEGIFARAASVAAHWEDAAHSLKGARHVTDIRNLGLLAAIDLESVPGKPGKRAYECHLKCLELGVMVRAAGDSIVLSPPLIIAPGQIDELFGCIAKVLPTID